LFFLRCLTQGCSNPGLKLVNACGVQLKALPSQPGPLWAYIIKASED
jgi:hypothetical protein